MRIRLRKQNNQDKIGKPFLFGGTLIALLLVVCGAVYLHGSEAVKEEDSAETPIEVASREPEYDSIESAAVVNQENMTTFINEPMAAAAQKDGRTPFRIIEVIPHPACSIFPYMVDWGEPEDYNDHLPVGYEGLISLIGGGGSLEWLVSSNKSGNFPQLYTLKEENNGKGRDSLKDYNVPIGTKDTVGAWYRTTDVATTNKVSGYFEYVGKGKDGLYKGMYYIAPTYVAESEKEKGIHYKTQAIPRSGTENPKGELYVKDPAYYQEKNYGQSYPTTDVESQTAYNYDLSFKIDEKGTYKAEISNLLEQRAGGKDFDYLLCVTEPKTWEYGFQYGKGGNYQVASAEISEEEEDGLYVRIEDNTKKDNYVDETGAIKPGYFRLYESSDSTVNKYKVGFKETEQSGGCYYAKGPVAWTGEIPGSYFQYVGAGKGIYNIPFIYAGTTPVEPLPDDGVVRYKESIVKVADGGERYALTSTTETVPGSGIPVYTDEPGNPSLHKDYAKVITYIDYNDAVSTGRDNDSQKGVTRGGNDNSPSTEKGGWVFVPDSSDMKNTFLSTVHDANDKTGDDGNNKFQPGQKIYVGTGEEKEHQNIKYRKYCRKGFTSNEIFKLCCWGSHTCEGGEGISYMKAIPTCLGYHAGKTTGWDKRTNGDAPDILSAFADKYPRIEIQQVTLDQLEPYMVKDADLIYISKSVGINGLTKTAWETMNGVRDAYGQERLPEWTASSSGSNLLFNDKLGTDLRNDTLFTLYNECVYERNVALIIDRYYAVEQYGTSVTSNISKLYCLLNFFKDAKNFAKFMPQMYPDEYNPKYTKIIGDTNVNAKGPVLADVYLSSSKDKELTSDQQGWYNFKFGEDPPTVDNWVVDGKYMGYFMVYKKAGDRYGGAKEEIEFIKDWSSTGNVESGETKLSLNGQGNYHQAIGSAVTDGKIWQILNNITSPKYTLQVLPTNAEKVVTLNGTRWVIYGNEMEEESFNIKYKVLLNGEMPTGTLINTTYVFDGAQPPLTGETALTVGDEYFINARGGFAMDNLYKNSYKSTVTITATDTAGITATVDVDVIVRETFDLN